jgi:lipoprotein-anchoring transpeptidase ErfK/SrfK
VTETITGEDGYIWYKVRELYQSFHIRATHLRIMAEDELTPLSPEVPPEEKHIEVNLSQQALTAYEYGEPVLAHMVSTGLPQHATPPGTFYVHDKRLSERMVGGSAADEDQSDRYNLGGVPFTAYFTGNWVALHGCYWHNDYGIPRSRGCVNLPTEASRFLWRWTTPAITPDMLDTMFVRPRNRTDGTRVEVFA